MLFARVDPLGVAWLRIVSAAIVFAVWRKPWRRIAGIDRETRRLLLALGAVFAVMNSVFYLAIDRLPLGTVAAIEFLPVILLAALGVRNSRNGIALALAVPGVYVLTDVRLATAPLGIAFAFANAALFAIYIVLAHPCLTQRCPRPDRRARRRNADRRRRDHPDRRLWRRKGVARSGRARRRHRRRRRLLGHPLCLRPARDGPAQARHLLADGLAAARHRDGETTT